MGLELPCGCGHVVHADGEASLVARAQQHARDAHGIEITPEHVRLAVSHAEVDTETWSEPEEQT